MQAHSGLWNLPTHSYILQSLSYTVDFPNLSQTDSLPLPSGPLDKIWQLKVLVSIYVSHLTSPRAEHFVFDFTHPHRIPSGVAVGAALLRLRVVPTESSVLRFACARREILPPICRKTLKNAEKDSEWK